MGKIVYNGDDFRVLSAADFKSLGVEDQKKITFAKGEPVEVTDEVAKVLLSLEEKFEVVEAGPDTIEGTEPELLTDANDKGAKQSNLSSTDGSTAAGASKKSSTTRAS